MSSHVLTMSGRSLRLARRNIDTVITALALPVIIMLLFVYLFGGASRTGSGAGYASFVVPGVLVLCASFSSSVTAVSVSADMSGAMIDRLRSMDIGGPALLAGHVAASLVRNAASTTLVIGVALMIGFHPAASPVDWALALAMLFAFVLAISWVAAALGLVARSPEAAQGLTFVLIFLPYASSGFVPISTMPSWLQTFSAHQPVTPVIDTIRGLMLGTPVGCSPWVALGWCAGIVVVSGCASSALFRRRTA